MRKDLVEPRRLPGAGIAERSYTDTVYDSIAGGVPVKLLSAFPGLRSPTYAARPFSLAVKRIFQFC
jgi:hypothetical protein